MRGKFLRPTVALAALGLGAVSAFGQFGSDSGNIYDKFGPGGSPVQGANGPIELQEGQQVRIGNSDTILVVGKSGIILPVGVAITVSDSSGANPQKAVVPLPRNTHSVGVFPLTYFSIAGTLYKSSTNEFVGGTRSVIGTVLSYDVVSNLDNGRRFEVGGFFFVPQDDNDGDLYQVAARYFPNKEIGLQVAYLDTTRSQRASSGSLHVLFDLSSQGAGVTKGKRISSRIGIGMLQNFTKEFNPDSGVFAHRNTTNFSTFFDLSLELSDRLKLNASEWFVRDRNNDVNRFGIGISYKL